MTTADAASRAAPAGGLQGLEGGAAVRGGADVEAAALEVGLQPLGGGPAASHHEHHRSRQRDSTFSHQQARGPSLPRGVVGRRA